MWRMWLVALLLTPTALWGVVYFASNSLSAQHELRDLVRQTLGSDTLTFGYVGLGAIPGDVHLFDLRVRDDDAIEAFHASQVHAKVDPLALVAGDIDVSEVSVRGFQIDLRLDSSGRLRLSKLFGSRSQAKPVAPSGGGKTSPRRTRRNLSIGSFLLEQGDIRVGSTHQWIALQAVHAEGSFNWNGADCSGQL